MNILNNRKFIEENQGNGNAIIGVLLILGICLVGFLIIEMGHLYLGIKQVKNDLDFANMAVWKDLDQEALAYNTFRLHKKGETEMEGYLRGKSTFAKNLVKNLELRPLTLTPLQPDASLIEGPIEIKEFEIYLSNDLPAVTPNGVVVDKVSIYSQINVNIKTLFNFFGKKINLDVDILSNVEDDLRR